MRMPAVAMRYDEYLMTVQVECSDDTIHHMLHRRAIDRIAGIEAERQMIDRIFDPDVLRSRRSHDFPGEFWIGCWEITRRAPGHAL